MADERLNRALKHLMATAVLLAMLLPSSFAVFIEPKADEVPVGDKVVVITNISCTLRIGYANGTPVPSLQTNDIPIDPYTPYELRGLKILFTEYFGNEDIYMFCLENINEKKKLIRTSKLVETLISGPLKNIENAVDSNLGKGSWSLIFGIAAVVGYLITAISAGFHLGSVFFFGIVFVLWWLGIVPLWLFILSIIPLAVIIGLALYNWFGRDVS